MVVSTSTNEPFINSSWSNGVFLILSVLGYSPLSEAQSSFSKFGTFDVITEDTPYSSAYSNRDFGGDDMMDDSQINVMGDQFGENALDELFTDVLRNQKLSPEYDTGE